MDRIRNDPRFEAPAPLRASILTIACLGVLSAGCQDLPESPPRHEPLLTEFETCPFRYPDGVTLNCRDSVAVTPDREVPAGWVCVDQVPATTVSDAPSWARFWGDLRGAYGIEYSLANFPSAGVFYGVANVTTSTAVTNVAIEGGRTGFIRFFGSNAGDIGWSLLMHGFNATGDPSILTTDYLRMSMTLFNGAPWYIWHFHEGDRSVFFDSMVKSSLNGAESWDPASLVLSGRDFHFRATAARVLYGASEYDPTDPLAPSVDNLTGRCR